MIGSFVRFIVNTGSRHGAPCGKARGGGEASRCPGTGSHFFLLALSAALVVLPCTSLAVVALITPTATVCLMSRTANLVKSELEMSEIDKLG